MRTATKIGLFLSLAVVVPALPQNNIDLAWVRTIPFVSMGQGEISYFRYGDEQFLGTDMLITDRCAWRQFWTAHTEGIQPPPPLPSVNFAKEMVIVTVLGYQTSGGGPSIAVKEVKWDLSGKLHVLIENNETPGPLDVITNPYHIVKLKKLPVRDVAFEHQKPV